MTNPARRVVEYFAAAIYWISVAACVVVLLACLTLWPLSYYRASWWPTEKLSSGGEAAFPDRVVRFRTAPCLVLADGAAWFESDFYRAIFDKDLPRFHPELAPGGKTIWLPAAPRWLVPFWSLAAVGGVGLGLLVCRVKSLSISNLRFRLSHLAWAVVACSLLSGCYRLLADAGAVVAGEAVFLTLVGRWAYARASASTSLSRYGWASVVAACVMGVVALAAFFVYCLLRFGPV